METVEVVIKLPQNLYFDIKNGYASNIQREKVIERVKNGIVLPKNHGSLKDVDHYIKTQWEHPDYSLTDDEPTIIEADKTESGG